MILYIKNITHILNIKLIIHVLGLVLLFESGFMFIDLFICFIYDHASIYPVAKSIVITVISGFFLYSITKGKFQPEPTKKDSFMVVTSSWFILSLFGTLPYLFSHSIPGFTDAFFESVSGFTTTGSSVLTDIETMPKGILFWRSETHWIGGMGIIVLVLSIFPYFKIGGMHLFGAESSAVVFEKIKPKLIDTAKRLWMIYILLTFLEIILLIFGGMNIFDSICHSFGTIATGGFSTKNTSIMNYSPYIQYVISIFMILSGINFVMHYLILKGDFKKVFRNEELRFFLLIIIFAVFIITLDLYKRLPIEESFRNSLFQVSSILTATGFSTANYEEWSGLSISVIVLLMFIGGCAGSTSGGIKVVRHLIAIKKISMRFKNLMHPSMIKPIKYNENIIEDEQIRSIISFLILYIITLYISTIIMISFGVDIKTSFGSVITTMGGIGPGLGSTGPAGNFSAIPLAGKYLLSFLMILGRLELYSVLILLSPNYWRV